MSKSVDMNLSIGEIKQLVGVFLLCYIFVHFCFTSTKYIYIFYVLYILKLLVIFYYSYNHGLMETVERFNLKELNANMFGYFGFFAIISAFFLWQSDKHILSIRILLFSLFFVTVSLSILSCFYAASRAGIVITSITSICLLILYYFYPFSKKSFSGILLFILISITLVPILLHNYEGSIMQERMQMNSLDDEPRIYLAMKAIDIGFNNPLFGVGPGNFILYSGFGFSHSTYTELLANNGIVALFIFISIFYYFLKKNRQYYLMGKSYRKRALYFYLFIFLYSVYNLFYGFHIQLFMMGFFYLVLIHLEKSISREG